MIPLPTTWLNFESIGTGRQGYFANPYVFSTVRRNGEARYQSKKSTSDLQDRLSHIRTEKVLNVDIYRQTHKDCLLVNVGAQLGAGIVVLDHNLCLESQRLSD